MPSNHQKPHRLPVFHIRIPAAVFAAVFLFTAGCSFIPEYQRPDLPVEDRFPQSSQDTSTAGSNQNAADLSWQDYFQSDTLCRIIGLALENNRDLRVALLNIERAKAAYRIQDADRMPVIAGNAGVNRQGIAKDNSSSGAAYTTNAIMSVGLGITAYELDFFGRIKSLSQSALETYLATQDAAASTRIALIAQTADAYVTLLAQQKLLKLAQDTYNAQKQTHDMIQREYDAGTTDQISLVQAATSTQSALTSVYQYKRLAAQAENALVYLSGPGVRDLIHATASIDNLVFLDSLPAGLPSSILLSRPDVMAAEHRLKAANADIGAARAALYPTISLTGSLGLASQSLSNLFNVSDSRSWAFSPALSIPIFNREGLNASLDAATVDEKIAAAQYEGTIQTAFKEVADQLAARKTYKDQLSAQNALVQATRKAYTLSRARYDNGVDDFLAVLDAQRSLFSAEQGEIVLRQAFLSNLINLYKTMGGGRISK